VKIESAEFLPAEAFANDEFRRTLGTLVLCKGVYDLTHVGHIESLRMASSHGDTLLVAVATDESVRMRKGLHRPVLTLRERLAIVRSLRMVDYVTTYDTDSPYALIRELRPHIFCATHLETLSKSERDDLERAGVGLLILPRPEERSTTDLIEWIVTNESRRSKQV
jgi:rfaE bifunctional protein nucleotidyltransferase chain/domain